MDNVVVEWERWHTSLVLGLYFPSGSGMCKLCTLNPELHKSIACLSRTHPFAQSSGLFLSKELKSSNLGGFLCFIYRVSISKHVFSFILIIWMCPTARGPKTTCHCGSASRIHWGTGLGEEGAMVEEGTGVGEWPKRRKRWAGNHQAVCCFHSEVMGKWNK